MTMLGIVPFWKGFGLVNLPQGAPYEMLEGALKALAPAG